jgi:hypothetical protein
MKRDTPAGARESQRADRGQAPDAVLGGRYRARGVEHDVYVVRLTSMRWQILDVTATDVVIVDTLEGYDDRFQQARALARDYASEKRAHHEGRREHDPLPPPGETRGGGGAHRR